MSQLKEGARKEVPILVKADVQGSSEAILQALEKLSTAEVAARVVHYGVGAISESDVSLAQASGAVVLGFNVRANQQARDAAEQAGIEIRYYNIIYDLVDDVKAVMSGLLPRPCARPSSAMPRSSRSSTSRRSVRWPVAASSKASSSAAPASG